jgi:hypothetical protein
MQPPGNVGSEVADTGRKAKLGKTSLAVESVVKNSKAQDILAKRKADAAKATLPPLAEKSTKLSKVSETLARRKIEAAKVAAAEREKKKTQDPTVPVETDKGPSLKKRPLDTAEKVKQLAVKEKKTEDAEASAKRARVDPVAETDEDVDIMPAPQIQPCTKYPPKGSAKKLVEGPPPLGQTDAEELEAREARGRRVAELIQKDIAMAEAAPRGRMAGLVDVVDESESLCYIDDDTTRSERGPDVPLSQPQCEAATTLNEGSGAKAQNVIDLDAPEVEASAAPTSRSPPPVSQDVGPASAKPIEAAASGKLTASESLQPEDAGTMRTSELFSFVFFLFITHFCLFTLFALLLFLAANTLVNLSVKDREEEVFQIEADPSASGPGLASMLGEPGVMFCLSFCFLIFDFAPSSC